MEKLIAAILAYIRENGLAVYSAEQIKVDGRPYFFITDEDTNELLTINDFIQKYYPEGEKPATSGYILSDYNNVIFLETKVWSKLKRPHSRVSRRKKSMVK